MRPVADHVGIEGLHLGSLPKARPVAVMRRVVPLQLDLVLLVRSWHRKKKSKKMVINTVLK